MTLFWPNLAQPPNNEVRFFQPFFAIPKSPKNKKANRSRFWRLDFHDQERNILKGAKKEYVKPLIKLLKVKPNPEKVDHEQTCTFCTPDSDLS